MLTVLCLSMLINNGKIRKAFINIIAYSLAFTLAVDLSRYFIYERFLTSNFSSNNYLNQENFLLPAVHICHVITLE